MLHQSKNKCVYVVLSGYIYQNMHILSNTQKEPNDNILMLST